MFYAAVKMFNGDDGEAWQKYTRWLGRTDLTRVVTLDPMLSPPVVTIVADDDWRYAVCEDFMLDYFTDLEFVRQRAAHYPRSQVLGVMRNPTASEVTGFTHPDFHFAGFDIVDTYGSASALLNCGGFPDVFSVDELSRETGLVTSHMRASEIRDNLIRIYPKHAHANCHVWAIWIYQCIMPIASTPA